MTISSQVREAGPFVGDDVTTALPFAFKVFSSADLYVVRLNTATEMESTLVLTTDYTVSLNADQNVNPGGTVTLNTPLATGYTVVVTSNITPLQQTDLTNQGGFYPRVITNALDKLTVLIQQLLGRVNRSLTLPITTTGVSGQLPVPSSNKVIGWNSTADALVNLDAANLATQIVGTNTIIDVFSGDGSTVAFVLTRDPLTENNTTVFISGVYQQKSDYSLSGVTLTFATAPPVGTNNIEVVQQLAQTYPVSSLTPNVVGTTHINDEAVTTAKLADDSVITAKILNGAVTGAKLAGDALNAYSSATPVASDLLPFIDLSDSNNVKKATISDIVALVSAVDGRARDQIALTNMKLLLNTSVASGALYAGYQWELATDELGAASTNETYTAGSPAYYTGAATEYTPTGSTFGDMTDAGGLAAAFNGTTTQIGSACAGKQPGTLSYCGKAFSAAQRISRVDVYGSSDAGYLGTASAQSLTITIYGKSSSPANATDGTVLGSTTFNDTQTTNQKQITCDPATAYQYVWATISTGSSTNLYFAEIKYFTAADVTLVGAGVNVPTYPTWTSLYFLWKDDSGAGAVLGTDLTVELSRDNGTTWTMANIEELMYFDATYRLLQARADLSSQPSATTLAFRVKMLNAKLQRVAAPAIYSE